MQNKRTKAHASCEDIFLLNLLFSRINSYHNLMTITELSIEDVTSDEEPPHFWYVGQEKFKSN